MSKDELIVIALKESFNDIIIKHKVDILLQIKPYIISEYLINSLKSLKRITNPPEAIINETVKSDTKKEITKQKIIIKNTKETHCFMCLETCKPRNIKKDVTWICKKCQKPAF